MKTIWKYCSVRTKKLHRVKVKKVQKISEVFFTGVNPVFFRAKNFNVSTKTLWSVLCWLLLCSASFWNFRIQWTSHDYLTEKSVSCVLSKTTEKNDEGKKKLVKWQKFKTALCDLTKKTLMSNFVRSQTHGWILLIIFF